MIAPLIGCLAVVISLTGIAVTLSLTAVVRQLTRIADKLK